MSSLPLRLLSLAAFTCLLSACAVPDATTTYSNQTFSGNWSFGISDPPGSAFVNSLVGTLSGSGENITGVFLSSGCVPSTQAIDFTGQQTSDGVLTLKSTNLGSNVITISGSAGSILEINGATTFLGSISESGGNECSALGSAILHGFAYAPLTGTFAGPLTSFTGNTATFTAVLSQTAADANGQFPETGTITVAGPTCTNTFAVTGLIGGPTLTATLTETSGPPATSSLYIGPQTSTTVTAFPFNMTIAGSGCNAGGYVGNLIRQ